MQYLFLFQKNILEKVAKCPKWLFWNLQILTNLFHLIWSIISKVIKENREKKKEKALDKKKRKRAAATRASPLPAHDQPNTPAPASLLSFLLFLVFLSPRRRACHELLQILTILIKSVALSRVYLRPSNPAAFHPKNPS